LVAYLANEEALLRLKHPLGKLITGPPERTMKVLKEVIERDRPTRVIAIGDVVTSNIMKSGIKVDFIVIDFKSKRQPVDPICLDNCDVTKIKNPAGVITPTAYEAVKDVCTKLEGGSHLKAIVVDGEEDLLTLPIVKLAPIGTLVVYGQPYAGIVLVKITRAIKHEAELIMEKMTKSRAE
jgi:uncharacterized protein (UPF0218 family)